MMMMMTKNVGYISQKGRLEKHGTLTSELCKNTICGDNCAGSCGVGGSTKRNADIWKRKKTFTGTNSSNTLLESPCSRAVLH